MASTDISAERQDTPQVSRPRVSLAAWGVGTRLISQPLTGLVQPVTLSQAAHHEQTRPGRYGIEEKFASSAVNNAELALAA